MAKLLLSDELWEVIEPLLAEEPPKPKGGRPRVPDRAALSGILFVLKTGIPWEMLPQEEMGCASQGMSCWRRRWRRLEEWHEAGCGSACTERCSTAFWDRRRTRSTGSGCRWTRRAHRPPGGPKDRQ